METIIGREMEMKRLETAVGSPRAEFIALYGRRRVGKTFLINQFFKNQYAFKMTGVIEGTLKDQFAAFADAMNDYGYEMPEQPKDWMQAFIMLKNALKPKVGSGERCIIFIDELPALDAEGSNAASAVGYFWNNWASLHENIVFIICGSATSWMISNVIDSKGGLHDRITLELPIHPFTLKETEDYLEEQHFIWNRQMVLQTYMVFGGIPYYLSLLDREDSLVQNIDRLFFSKDTQMRREFRRLFNTLYKKPDKYIEIIKVLSNSRKGMTREELADKLKCANNGHLGKRLEDLVYCDLIRKNIVREKDSNEEYEQEAISKNLIPCNGAITDRLKKDWGMNDVWNSIVLPRFQRLNQITGKDCFTTTNGEGHEIPAMPIELQKGFNKKRIDHRHHAMDAIVIACTTRDHVNLLNNEAAHSKSNINRYQLQRKLRKYEKVIIDGKARDVPKEFLKPWDSFTTDAKNTLESIIVSFKQNQRVINKTSNYTQHFNDQKKKVLVKQAKGDSWAIRKPMHKDTVFGEVNLKKIKNQKRN